MGAALNPQLANFRDNIWDESLPCSAIEIPEGLSKEGKPYITFCSWEATSYIRDLIRLRESRCETVKPSSHICTAHGSTEQLSVSRFENLWRKLCRNAGVDLRPVEIEGRYVRLAKGGMGLLLWGLRYHVRLHTLRNFFRTALAVSGVDRMAPYNFISLKTLNL